ncbi:MAG TPA: tRNA pseudouridine synthase A [Candidatus Acidoferrales bacterium]|nr:tRNA pseudouridine synthase A [Candidatus Acidoferrales bacterium]
MKNIKLTLAYDGTGFHGWQIQPGRETIQGALAEVAERLVGCRTPIHGAGRTDAGVHALGQVANFRANTRLGAEEFQRAFNALLPAAIRVVQAEEVEPRFHARWDAQSKIYQYRIHRGRVLGPFSRFYALHYPFPLDEQAMTEAALAFEGEHDFTSFAASPGADADGKEVNPVRVVLRSELVRRPARDLEPPAGPLETLAIPAFSRSKPPDELVYVVHGRSFLRNMVRKIVGTLLEVGRGRLSPAELRELFEARDRSRSGPTVPPQGLYLAAVEYAEPWRIGTP